MRRYELSIRPFRQVACDKEQALKPLEEAAEIYGAWTDYDHGEENAAELWNGRVEPNDH